LTVTANTRPTPASADNYKLLGEERKVKADAALASVTITIVGLSSEGRTDATANAQRAENADFTTSDALGQWDLDIAKTAVAAGARLRLKKNWTDAAGVAQEETWEGILDVSKVNEYDQLYWADIELWLKS
jgi:hypothetical protein